MSPDDITTAMAGAAPRQLVQMRLAIAEYDRTRPLIDGRVQPEGIILRSSSPPIGEFCVRPVYEEYDVAEMSFSLYVAARARGDNVVALPIFPLRMPVHGFVFCRDDAPYATPADLKGKRIASTAYRNTCNLWLRGIFQDHYGLAPEDVTWVVGREEIDGYVVPKGITVELHKGRQPGDLLLSGLADAVIGPEAPDEYKADDRRIRRLFHDVRGECAAYFRRTGIFPITHLVVMSEDTWRARPWIVQPLMDAFREAQRQCDEYYYKRAKHVSFPDAVFFMEEERRIWGKDHWAHGVAPNRHVIETFVRYAHEQGNIGRRLAVEELFAPNALDL